MVRGSSLSAPLVNESTAPLFLAAFAWVALISGSPVFGQRLGGDAWPRFAVDNQPRGADGVKIADANGDGLPDLVTGWEESGTTKVYLHPGLDRVNENWPSVEIGETTSVEDAAWCDVNRDGRLDVVTCCEGKEQSIKVHLAPLATDRLLLPDAWRMITVPASQRVTRWMFAVPFDDPVSLVDENTGSHDDPVRLVVGSKMPSGMMGLLSIQTNANRTKINANLHKLCDASWIMSIVPIDVDEDGDLDIAFTDRKDSASGVYWLENPGSFQEHWEKHLIGLPGAEVMFMQRLDTPLSADGEVQPLQLAVAVKPNQIAILTRPQEPGRPWSAELITLPSTRLIGNAKAVAVGDLDGDDVAELVFSCESAVGQRHGLVYLKRSMNDTAPTTEVTSWSMRDISGSEGTKFDLIELIDLDRDGDLDVLTCEERYQGKGLGLIWYANPLR